MTKNLDSRKIVILKLIASMESEKDIQGIEMYLKKSKISDDIKDIFKPLKESISIDEMKRDQNFKGINRKELKKLIKKLDIKEPFEELLSMID